MMVLRRNVDDDKSDTKEMAVICVGMFLIRLQASDVASINRW